MHARVEQHLAERANGSAYLTGCVSVCDAGVSQLDALTDRVVFCYISREL